MNMSPLTISLTHYSTLFLLIVLISNKCGGNDSNDYRNNNTTVEYECCRNFTAGYGDETERNNFRSNSTNDIEAQLTNSANDNREDNDTVEHAIELMKSQRSQIEIYANFTNSENKSDLTYDSHENSTVDGGKNNTIQLCCPYGHRLSLKKQECIAADNATDYAFPNVSDSDEPFDQVFELVVRDPCANDTSIMHFRIDPVVFPDSAYYFLTETSSAYFPHHNIVYAAPNYCLAAVNQNKYEMIICRKLSDRPIYVTVALVVSLPFFLITFAVYCVLPKFRNMHGYTLRAYIASLFLSYTILPLFREVTVTDIDYSFCVALSLVLTFSALSGFFWLNVIWFDIWWTFGGFRPIHKGRVRPKREKKTFVMYALYAWGIPFLITVLTAVMDFVTSIPPNLVLPKFCTTNCWFETKKAIILYFRIPVVIVLICNICLFVFTALKILLHQRSTDNALKGSQSQRYNDNKQRFLMYLKLFIAMGITWTMEAAVWIFNTVPFYVWLFSDMMNGLQGVIIFVIFVCKRKIIRLLLKRFGFKKSLPYCSSFLSSESSVVTVSTTRSSDIPMQQIDSNTQSSAPANNSKQNGH